MSSDEAARHEAAQFWGFLIRPDKSGSDTLDRLLTAIATFISSHFDVADAADGDVRPAQLAAFYRAVGGNYDVLFVDTPPSSLAFIYRSLGCFHSLQPTPADDGYSSPTVPALKPRGFVTWQTIQLLLGPDQHVPFLQHTVRDFDIIDPASGQPFPKLLPAECFPDKPDDAMEQWYDGVAERLRREAEESTSQPDPFQSRTSNRPYGAARVDAAAAADPAHERHGAARYFEDPLYRKTKAPRPSLPRRVSKPRSPMQFVEDRGRMIANSVRHMWNPSRRRSLPTRYASTDEEEEQEEEDDDEDDDEYRAHSGHESEGDRNGHGAPTAGPSRLTRSAPHGHTAKPPKHYDDSFSANDSESSAASLEAPQPVHAWQRPRHDLRHRRSHESPMGGRRDYVPTYHDVPRADVPPRTSLPRTDYGTRSPPSYGPTHAPLFATHVAQLQAQQRPYAWHDRSSGAGGAGGVSPGSRSVAGVRYSSPTSSSSTPRPRPRDRYDYGRGRAASDSEHRHHGQHGRRRSPSRSPSHDRDRNRDRDRDRHGLRDRDRDRDRDRRAHHGYGASGDGGSARRYPAAPAWR